MIEVDPWNVYFLELAKTAATRSKDPSTKVGAVIVEESDKSTVDTGFNGLPRGHPSDMDPTWYEDKQKKYRWTVCAERNAIYAAAKHGRATNGAVIYTTHPPCAKCCLAIWQAGITKVYVDKAGYDAFHEREDWAEELAESEQMLKLGDIELNIVEYGR